MGAVAVVGAVAMDHHLMPQVEWVLAAVGLGSNLQEPAAQVTQAIGALEKLPRTKLVAVSPLYRSQAVGADGLPVPQPDFCNAAALLDTQLSPQDLLAELQGIEMRHGRLHHERWQARSLDLDLLLYGEQRLQHADLVIPHPRMSGRNFVLFPLRDIAPGLRVPGLGVVQDLAAQLDTRGLTRWQR